MLAGSNHQWEDVLDIQSTPGKSTGCHLLKNILVCGSMVILNRQKSLVTIQRLHLFTEVLSVTRLPFQASMAGSLCCFCPWQIAVIPLFQRFSPGHLVILAAIFDLLYLPVSVSLCLMIPYDSIATHPGSSCYLPAAGSDLR